VFRASARVVPSMPNEVVIKVENLGKSYLIGHEMGNGRRQESFREVVGRHALSFARAALDMSRGRQIIQGNKIEEFWALSDVSFEITRGEVLGIIGRNGAGKSTLLKILSRITEPTRGRATIKGRVASLLEVGTGFHQDLTGRENIYLNGAILGMSRAEIKSKFDEIVDFAEIEKFLDTPVKRYSSGMYVRLAFAVAAHLEPEILIIDEVLAVGDVVFQRKCLGKMKNVAQHGRTVIFVSHNLPAIIGLTSRTVLIEKGRLIADGPSNEVVSRFLQSTQNEIEASGDLSAFRRDYRSEGYVNIRTIKVCGNDPGVARISFRQNVVLDIGLQALRSLEHPILVINVLNEQLEVLTSITSIDSDFGVSLDPGFHTIRCDVGALPLMPGYYRLSVGITQSYGALAWDVLEPIPGFRIEPQQSPTWLQSGERPGVVLLDGCKWMLQG
jgi:ABC-type polysaccharide/polyol phosphate transport system ATPase subunit